VGNVNAALPTFFTGPFTKLELEALETEEPFKKVRRFELLLTINPLVNVARFVI
jgi:hypothetical protein